MSATTIKRGGKGVRRATAAKGKARAVRGAKQKTGGAVGAAWNKVPISETGLQKFFIGVFIALAAVSLVALAIYAGLPEAVRDRVGGMADDAGFTVRKVEVRGVDRMDRQAIYERAVAVQQVPMPLMDVDVLREDLLQLPWVSDARVSRQLPDTLVIDIVERRPHAVLREGEEYVLIDPSGHRLEPVKRGEAEKMLVLSGEGAANRAVELSELLDAAPALKPQVRAAEWVGNRRWNLTFKTGQVVALPEGDEESSDALVSFARLDGMNRLLGGKVSVFDMRADDRIYMRVPGRAAEEAEMEAQRKRLEREAAQAAAAQEAGEEIGG